MEMDRVARANGSPRMLLGRKLAIVNGEIGDIRIQGVMEKSDVCRNRLVGNEAMRNR
jgi:hypothetical protein